MILLCMHTAFIDDSQLPLLPSPPTLSHPGMLSIPSKSLFDFQVNLVHNLEQPKESVQHVIGK